MHWEEIVRLGWRDRALKENLRKYRDENARRYINLTLDQYASAVHRSASDFVTEPLKSYCLYPTDLEIQKLLAFFAMDVQRENGGYEKVLEIAFKYEEAGLWAFGLAVKEK